jgi:DNA-binding CsgD family transcriptional regulator
MTDIDQLRSRFSLTPHEAKLVLCLIEGKTLRLASALLDISYETARTYLKSIFQKTNTCRQAELVLVVTQGGQAKLGPTSAD